MAIKLASLTYGVPYQQMISVARCETGGTFSATAVNQSSGATGLFQFLKSTWEKTPYHSFNRTNPYANSLAAGWLVRKDHGWSEWTCQP